MAAEKRHQERVCKSQTEWSDNKESIRDNERSVKEAAEGSKKIAEFIGRHKKAFAIIVIAAALVVIICGIFSSCSVMFEGAGSAIASTTYPSKDSEMLAAEKMYKELEQELSDTISNYENTHNYDEYIYELDDIEHDPYVLISALTALHPEVWTLSDVENDISDLFNRQYELSESVRTEQRTRTVSNPDGTTSQVTYNYRMPSEMTLKIWQATEPS